MKILKTLTYTILSGSLFIACINPKADAKKVCDCYQNIADHPEEEGGFKKCMGLQMDLTVKYKDKPSKLMEFMSEIDSCTSKLKPAE